MLLLLLLLHVHDQNQRKIKTIIVKYISKQYTNFTEKYSIIIARVFDP